MEIDAVEPHVDNGADSDNEDSDYTLVSPNLARAQRRHFDVVAFREHNRTRKSSWIWHVGDQIEENGVEKWRCGLCKGDTVKRYTLSSTCHIKRHLEESHGFATDNRLAAIGPGQSTLDRYLLTARPDPAAFKRKLIEFFIVCRIPFHLVESAYFRALFEHNSTIANAVPNSSDTIRAWTLNAFDNAKDQLRAILGSSRSKIHISIDGWTSPNLLPIIGIVGHWADTNGRFQKGLLALRELEGLPLIQNVTNVQGVTQVRGWLNSFWTSVLNMDLQLASVI